jgi:hypothetical protein
VIILADSVPAPPEPLRVGYEHAGGISIYLDESGEHGIDEKVSSPYAAQVCDDYTDPVSGTVYEVRFRSSGFKLLSLILMLTKNK